MSAKPYSLRERGFTLIEIMIVILIIGMMLMIAIPSFTKARENSRYRSCMKNISHIESAKDQLAIESRLNQGALVTMAELEPYIRIPIDCPSNGVYDIKTIGDPTVCSYATH